MTWRVVEGDCVEAMAAMPAESVDAVVCDPPYGINFMGKAWDGAAITALAASREADLRARGGRPDGGQRGSIGSPAAAAGTYDQSTTANRAFQAWCEAWAREALRVLKPGGHLLAFGGTRTYHRLAAGIEDAGFEIRDCLTWLYGSGFPKSLNLNGEWQGWGTALKPAHEPIVVARKPLTGTVAGNVLTHGTGALNIDGCRIGTDDDLNGGAYSAERKPSDSEWVKNGGTIHSSTGREYEQPAGRWPANVLLDGSAADQLDPDGEWSRFFFRAAYVAKAGTAERNAGLDGFEAQPVRPDGAAFGEMTMWNGQNGDDEWRAKNPNKPRANVHPTVKPIDLMRWLVRLVTPPGGTVLDPFAGSGTTGCAAVLEGFAFVGIEREAEYAAIARARIEWWSRRPGVDTEDALRAITQEDAVAGSGQGSIFDLEDMA